MKDEVSKKEVPEKDRVNLFLEDGYLVVRIPIKAKIVPEIQKFVSFDGDLPIPPLPPRSLEVFHLLRAGLSNKEIGEKLGIGISAVNVHINKIFRKLGVSGKSEIFLMYGPSRRIAVPDFSITEDGFHWKRELKDSRRSKER